MSDHFYHKHGITPPSPLFEMLEDTFYFAKDLDGHFVYPNRLLQERFGLANPSDVIGKTDFDFFSPAIATLLRQDDLAVIKKGTTIKNKLEVVDGQQGKTYWLFTSKSPVRDNTGAIVGIEGYSRDAERSVEAVEPYKDFKNIIDYVKENIANEISVVQLARVACMSLTTFERKFKRHFNCAPKHYIKRLRIQDACRLLERGDNIKSVAQELGFCDQSYFTKEFRSTIGLTPKQYQVDALKINS